MFQSDLSLLNLNVWITMTSVLILTVSGEIFSSMEDMESLVLKERNVLHMLRIVQNQEALTMAAVKKFHKHAENLSVHDKNDNPVRHLLPSSIKTVSRIKKLIHWKNLLISMIDDRKAEMFLWVSHWKNDTQFPDAGDITGSADAINRLQQTYKVYPEQVAEGKIPGIRPNPAFTLTECFMVGMNQAREGHHRSAAEWLRIALLKFEQENETSTAKHAKILDWLQFSVFYDNGNITNVLELTRQMQQLLPNDAEVAAKVERYETLFAQLNITERRRLAKPADLLRFFDTKPDDMAYEALCRGENNMGSAKRHRCYYENHKNPYLLLQPVKMEAVHTNPDIFVLHNIVFESQMEQIKSVGYKHLERAEILDIHAQTGIVTKGRVSKAGFLEADLDSTIAKVHYFSGQVTNLDSAHAEPFQLNNYGIGGYFFPHWDYEEYTEMSNNYFDDRIATLLVYMSDVEAGGATVFPKLNVTLFPEKGSAAFWYNLYRDGTKNEKTMHAGCPVLSGNKWVANVWFNEATQDVTRPCGLDPDGPKN